MNDPQERFTEMWHAEAPHVLAFARRHVGVEAAHDVVAETFMIAWRRWDDISAPPIAWLLVTARKVIQNRNHADTISSDRPADHEVRFTYGVPSNSEDLGRRNH